MKWRTIKRTASNTVTIDGEDSSEVWHGSRVARRARPQGLVTSHACGSLVVSCAHDGYTRLKGRPVHRRELTLGERELVVRDEITDAGGLELRLAEGVTPEVTDGFHASQFGRLIRRPVIRWHRNGTLPFAAQTMLFVAA